MPDQKIPEISLPPILDSLVPPDAKICPFMAPQIMMMPIIPMGKGLLTPAQQPTGAFVRHFVPCVKSQCMLWDESGQGCSQGVFRPKAH